MKDSDSQPSPPKVLSDELAHRVLARAVELDVFARSGTTVDRLREIARELSIPEATFDAALTEVQRPPAAPPPGLFRRWLQRVRGQADASRPWGDALLANAATFAAFWAALGLVTTATRGADTSWQVDAALRLIVSLGGVALARHLQARPVGFVLATTTIAQLAEYAIHLVYGIQAAQGADTHFAVLLAAGLGVALTSWGWRSPKPVVDSLSQEPSRDTPADRSQWTLVRGAHSAPTFRAPAAS